MHALVRICINQHTKFEMPSFTHYKDMIGTPKFKNGLCDPYHALFGVVCHPWARTCHDQPTY